MCVCWGGAVFSPGKYIQPPPRSPRPNPPFLPTLGAGEGPRVNFSPDGRSSRGLSEGRSLNRREGGQAPLTRVLSGPHVAQRPRRLQARSKEGRSQALLLPPSRIQPPPPAPPRLGRVGVAEPPSCARREVSAGRLIRGSSRTIQLASRKETARGLSPGKPSPAAAL